MKSSEWWRTGFGIGFAGSLLTYVILTLGGGRPKTMRSPILVWPYIAIDIEEKKVLTSERGGPPVSLLYLRSCCCIPCVNGLTGGGGRYCALRFFLNRHQTFFRMRLVSQTALTS